MLAKKLKPTREEIHDEFWKRNPLKFDFNPSSITDQISKDIMGELWKRNKIEGLLHSGQRKISAAFDESKYQLFVANVSRQFGKSFWAVVKAIWKAQEQPGARIKYGTAFHTDLVDFIIPTFEAVLSSCPDWMRPKYKTHGSRWVFKNGSEIKLIGLDRNPNKLRGTVLDMIIIDESGFTSRLSYIYKSIIIPATTHRPNCRVIMISTPPSTPAHEFKDFVEKAMVRNSYIELNIYQNPLLKQEDFDRLAEESGGVESTTWLREYLCQFILDDNLALCREWKDEFIQKAPKDQYFGYYHKYVGMDLGRKDHTALIFGYYDFKKATLFIQDELTMYGPTWTTVTLKDEVLKKEEELWDEMKPFKRISDNNNEHLIVDLGSLHSLHFQMTDKESLEAMVNEVRIMVGNGQIIIDPKCTMLIGCLKFGIWDDKRNEFARSKVYGHFDHFASLMYTVRNLAKHSNPIPIDHGYSNDRSWMGNIKSQIGKTPNARTMEKVFAKAR